LFLSLMQAAKKQTQISCEISQLSHYNEQLLPTTFMKGT